MWSFRMEDQGKFSEIPEIKQVKNSHLRAKDQYSKW